MLSNDCESHLIDTRNQNQSYGSIFVNINWTVPADDLSMSPADDPTGEFAEASFC